MTSLHDVANEDGCVHKVRTYKEYHSVVPRRNWDSPPTPFSPASVPLPPETGGRGTLACGWGVGGESQFRRGATLWYSLYVRTLWLCTFLYKAAGNSISSQLGSSCQGNRYGTAKVEGTTRPSHVKSQMPGHSPPAGQVCRHAPSVSLV
jgi:hypothetical protein